MRTALLLALMVGGGLALTYAYHARVIEIPDRWNPWAPLLIAEEPNMLTRYKLARLSQDREQCRSVLAQAQMRYTPIADRETGPGCGYSNAVRIERPRAPA